MTEFCKCSHHITLHTDPKDHVFLVDGFDDMYRDFAKRRNVVVQEGKLKLKRNVCKGLGEIYGDGYLECFCQGFEPYRTSDNYPLITGRGRN